jgi:transcriptional regulator with XRE-family HTH domain
MHVMNKPNGDVAAEIPKLEQIAAHQLRLLRQARRWSQLEVAEKMRAYGYQWSQATVTRLEAASRPIRLNELADLAALYGVPVTQFLESPPEGLTDLEEEIERLRAEHAVLTDQLRGTDATAAKLAISRAEIAAQLTRVDGRMEALARWRPWWPTGDGRK